MPETTVELVGWQARYRVRGASGASDVVTTNLDNIRCTCISTIRPCPHIAAVRDYLLETKLARRLDAEGPATTVGAP